MGMRNGGVVERDEGRTGCRVVVGAVVVAVVMVAALPDALHACPVCFDRDDEARIAFLATTGLLTLLPLGLGAGAGAWLGRRMREVRVSGFAGSARVVPARSSQPAPWGWWYRRRTRRTGLRCGWTGV